MRNNSHIDELLAQANEYENLGDYAQAVRSYRLAIDEMEVNDPRRERAVSNVEYLQGLGMVQSDVSPETGGHATRAQDPDLRSKRHLRLALVLAAVVVFGCIDLVALLGLQTRLYPGSVAGLTPGQFGSATNGIAVVPTPAAAPTFEVPTLELDGSPQAESTLPSATPTLNLPPTALPILPPAPTVVLKTNTTGKTVFEDVFDKGKLDLNNWVYENQKGALLEWSHGTMRIYSGASHDGYVYSHVNPFPTEEEFSASIRWRYFRLGACHAAVGMSTFAPPSPDTPRTPTSDTNVSIWLGYGGVHYSSDQETQDILVPDWGTGWHDIVVSYLNSQYVINVDGKTVFTSHPTEARARTLWFGNPADLGAGNKCEWDTLEVERVKVDQLANQQGLRSVGAVGENIDAREGSKRSSDNSAAQGANAPSEPKQGSGNNPNGNGKGKGKGK